MSAKGWSSCLVPLGALLCYLLLSQEKGYGDGPSALLRIRYGTTFQNPVHFLYMPMVAAVHGLLEPLGASLFTAARLLSATGAALGVWLLWRATRLLDDSPGNATRTALLVAFSPGVVFFATVVEYHGPFLAFAGLATLAMARLARSPVAARAVLLGVATGLAFFAHASAHLLPCLLLPTFLALVVFGSGDGNARIPLGRGLALAGMALAAHVVTVLLGSFLLESLGVTIPSHGALGTLQLHVGRPYDRLALGPITIWYEFLRPLAPLSLVWWLGFRSTRNRPLTCSMLLALLPFLVLCVLLVPGFNEHGAYLLPLAWLLAWILVRSAASWLVAVVFCASVVLAIVEVRLHDDPAAARSYAAGVREITAGRPTCLVIGNFQDCEATAMQLPRVSHFDLTRLAALPGPLVQGALQRLDHALAERLDGGQVVLLSQGGQDLLLSPQAAQTGAGPVLWRHLQQAWRLEPVAAGGFSGYRILPRQPR